VQTVTSTHETADRSATLLPSEAFVGVTIQVEPFHCSAPVPTAMQTFGDGHETPSSSLDSPLGLSACWMTHFAPFQRSTRVVPPAVPTAVQTLAVAQDTAFSLAPPLFTPKGFGVLTITQRRPFHFSARV
jgi:hypothetical protein